MSGKPTPEEPNTIPPTATDDSAKETGADGGAGPQSADEVKQAGDEGTAADSRVVELDAQIADLTDRLLRAHAEMDNIRKRAERDKAETAKYAISKFAADIAVLSDNFQRAIEAVPAGAAEQDAALKALLDGVTMMEREFLNVLARYGVKRVDPKGKPFNPHLHQAVMEQQHPEVPTGTVVQVFQPGYTIEDRVLRPAMVVVAKGGPKAQAAEKPADQKPGADAEAEQLPEDANANEAPLPGGEPEKPQ
jgi:molecular chaperone GrpE